MRDAEIYRSQGFGQALSIRLPYGLLLVDFVNGFADPGLFGGGNIPDALARSRALLELARSRNWPIAHSRIVFADDGSDANLFARKVPSLLQLTEHAACSAICDAVAPVPGELIVRKTLPSAFAGTSLAAWLTERGVKTLVIAGTTTSGCIRASVVDGMSHGFIPVVVSDCVGDRSLVSHQQSLFELGQKYAMVTDLSALERELRGA